MSQEPSSMAELCDRIGPPDRSAARFAAVRLRTLARPPGALGRLDELVPRISAIRGDPAPGPLPAVISVLAADHGLARHSASAFPQHAGGRVLALALSGRAPVNILADRVSAQFACADFGLTQPVGDPEYRMGPGTGDISVEDAMSAALAERAVLGGARYAQSRLGDEPLVAVGEIGIGNTTAAAALAAVLLDLPPDAVVGAGSGVDASGVARKHGLVAQALHRTARISRDDPMALIAALGGFEIAGNVGVILAAAAARRVVVLDGFITGVAALLAVRLCPQASAYLVAAHRSAEPGHQPVLEAIGLEPLLDLGMRLGMGSGAAMVLGLINTTLELARSTPRARDVGLALQEGDT
ncbi:nicotinate-nucleotide--dimethylbenzimidazole phosphoribosyltransferase [Streptomyces sp. NPDC060184]|uniref:nicotinate-nucleotide--dimethylbenzimidazole phosphoribosyltransferase n=1 Tax=Streptomyces sp. NPDC060184 TaxID=3347064 RepID=UPI0036528A55